MRLQKTQIIGSLMLAGAAPMAQATSYDVSAVFTDSGMQLATLFKGSFDWNGSTVSHFTGFLSEAMWGWNTASNAFRLNGMNGGMTAGTAYTGNVYAKPGGYGANEAPLLNLVHQLGGGAIDPATGLVTVTTFLQNSTNVVWGGGYDVSTPNGSYAYGAQAYTGWDGNARNFNAFFTLAFDPANPANTASGLSQIVYGDCSALGLMSAMLKGNVCMTGLQGGGTMGGEPYALAISPSAAVPLPSASCLFAGSLFSLIGVFGRRNIWTV